MGSDNNSENDKILFFMHIPKTAGRSLDHIIKRQYHHSEYFGHLENYYLASKELKKLPQKRSDKIKCITGHFCFGIHQNVIKPFTYITMLKNPIDRVIDMYYFIQCRPNHHLEKYKNMSLKKFVKTDDYIVQNLQTRYILGTGEYFPADLTFKKDVGRAKQIINNYFSIVGIVDQFDSSVFLMKKIFGWKNILYAKKNVTPNCPSKEEIPKKIINIIKENNKLDMELYNYAKKKIRSIIKALDTRTKQELEEYLYQNKLFQQHEEKK